MASKTRLDLLMVEQGLAESRALAQRLVMAGQVRVNGQVALKPSQTVASNVVVELDQGPPFVSRGGEKLAAALAAFPVDPSGRVCADVGASTGGFTDCLLQRGAVKVYAIDVGHGILHWKLRNDPRVVVMEKTNARNMERLPEPVSLATIDASFISLKILLPVVKGWLGAQSSSAHTEPLHCDLIALIKPQFEAGRAEVQHGQGVIRDPQIHQRVTDEIIAYAQSIGFNRQGLIQSPLLGPKGNVEFLLWLQIGNLLQDGPNIIKTADAHR
jgi:23S rRNA (cytidine1920-2'-O)/16S rRNA (cytidine1409-2'-O)-methyltransferase